MDTYTRLDTRAARRVSTIVALAIVTLSFLLAPTTAQSAAEPADATRAVPSPEAAESAEDPAAAYGADHLVVAGANEPGWSADEPARFEYFAYYPTDLQIHRGDVVFFRLDSFHTVTFSPEGEPREGFLRRDEVEPFVVALEHERPSDPTCGTSAEAKPCVLDSTDEFVNSGFNDLKLRVDLPEGAYSYYCTLHTGMQGSIEVVPDEVPIPSPADVEADRQAEVAADTATAHDILADPPAMRPPEQVGDHRRWFVQAGEVSPDQRVVAFQFFPSTLTIGPGDEVEFDVPEVGETLPGRIEPVAEFHTVTFEPQAVHDNVPGLVHYVNPMCDPDDPEHGLAGVPLFPALVLGCPDGLTFELGLQPWAYQDPLHAPGNTVATEATYHDSGILVPPDNPCRTGCDPWTGERLASTLPASFPNEGQFVFRCQVHGLMRGAVTVSG